MFKLLSKIIYSILLLIETLVVLRIIFVFLGATSSNALVKYVMNFSGLFVKPFSGIVSNQVNIGNFTIDTTAILALIIYLLLAFVSVELIKAFSGNEKNE